MVLEKSLTSPFTIKKLKKNSKRINFSFIFPVDPLGRREFNLNGDFDEVFYFLNFKFILRGNLLFVSPSFGPSQTAFLLECMIKSGLTNFIVVGSCGTLKDIPSGSVVVPDMAYSTISLTEKYLPHRENFFPSSSLNLRILNFLTERGINDVYGGRVATTDAIFRETKTFLTSVKDLGCDYLDMECAAAFSVGEVYGVNVSAILLVLDVIEKSLFKKKVDFLRYLVKMKKILSLIESFS